MSGPLEGLRVVELAEGVAAPYCSQELADAGADVIKVERAGGDRSRGWGSRQRGDIGAAFLQLNRGKRGVALDPDSEAGVEILRKLIADADIVIADAGWAGDDGLQYASLGELNPQLVYCRFSEYGEQGPWADQPPYSELAAQLAGEATTSLGNIGEPPVRMATDLASTYAAVYAVMSICAAIYARDENGGQRIDISLFGSILAMRSTLWVALSNPDDWWGFHLDSYVKPPDTGYHCKDGAIYFSLARTTPEQREELYSELGMEWVKDDPLFEIVNADSGGGGGRYSHIARPVWERALANFTTEEAMEITWRYNGWAFPKNDYDALVNDPQVQHVEMIQTVEQPGFGTLRSLAPPWDFEGTPAGIQGPAPLLGEHNAAVLVEAGYSEAAIAGFRAEGVLSA